MLSVYISGTQLDINWGSIYITLQIIFDRQIMLNASSVNWWKNRKYLKNGFDIVFVSWQIFYLLLIYFCNMKSTSDWGIHDRMLYIALMHMLHQVSMISITCCTNCAWNMAPVNLNTLDLRHLWHQGLWHPWPQVSLVFGISGTKCPWSQSLMTSSVPGLSHM